MKVKFTGPDNQINYSLGIEVGSPYIESGMVYDVSDKLGKSLVRSSTDWEEVKESSRKTEVEK